MAITFTDDRYFRTDTGSRIFQNVPLASASFKLQVLSATPPSIPNQAMANGVGKGQFDFSAFFVPSVTTSTVILKVLLSGTNGACSTQLTLQIGVVYVIILTWDGVTGKQTAWVSGVPVNVPSNSGGPAPTGNTDDRSQYMQVGLNVTNGGHTYITWTADDVNVWDNYLLTSSDINAITNNGDPTTIGAGATWRGRWTLSGIIGTTPTIGDDGLKNAYGGGGSLGSGGDGSDFITAGGSGSAAYAASLNWGPQVELDTTAGTASSVCSSGQAVAIWIKSTFDGARAIPQAVSTVPTLSVNGNNLGSLGTAWFTGGNPFLWYATPGNYQILPTDVVTLNAPVGWCTTDHGGVAGLNNFQITNLTGRPNFGSDTATKTLLLGMNNAWTIGAWYFPLTNLKYWWGGKTKMTTPYEQDISSFEGSNNGIDQTAYPGIAGLWLVMWDDLTPSTPTTFTMSSFRQGITTTCTERQDLKQMPSNGIGMMRVFDFENIPGNTGGSGGSYCADVWVTLRVSGGPGGHPNYDNFWLVAPGDWQIVGGIPVLDRSDPYALSPRYLDRLTNKVGSLRFEDSGPVGANPTSMPYPEQLPSGTDESYHRNWVTNRVGYSAFGPVDTTATPWIYSERFLATGQSFTATLANPVATTPAQGTHETWTISDAATAPVMAGLILVVDSEACRIISVSGTSVVVVRGSVWNGSATVPATHAAGTITIWGRLPITNCLNSSGYFGNALVTQWTTSVPHGVLTGIQPYADGSGYPSITYTTGETNIPGSSYAYVTGPTTFFQIDSSHNPSGGKPTGITALNPTNQYWDQTWPRFGGTPYETQAQIASRLNCDLWVNVHFDMCDDGVYNIAQRVLSNLTPGRSVYIEYGNEPWNWVFSGFRYLQAIFGPLVMHTTDFKAYYLYRAVQVHTIFRNAFSAVGRGNEIKGILNCQMAGNHSQYYLTTAAANGWQIDAIALAPYVSLRASANNETVFNALNDAQAIDMLSYDVLKGTGQMVDQVSVELPNITTYNSATGYNCELVGYEGGIEFAVPYENPSTVPIPNRDERNHDIVTHPNFYFFEQDLYLTWQNLGFHRIQPYNLVFPHAPQEWGFYKSFTQGHGYGDGRNGTVNNLLCRANHSSPNYKGANVNQDAHTVSVRGQAFIDWLNGVSGGGGPTVPTSVTLSGPTSGQVGTQSLAFQCVLDAPVVTGTVSIIASSSVPGDRVISPPSLIEHLQSGTFRFTPNSPGPRQISITTTPTLTVIGSPIVYTAYSPTQAPTSATLSGVSSGVVGVPSQPFSVVLDVPALAGGVSCVVSSDALGDVLTPSSVLIAEGQMVGAFTVTAQTAGSRNISLASTVPPLNIWGSPIVYSASPAPLGLPARSKRLRLQTRVVR